MKNVSQYSALAALAAVLLMLGCATSPFPPDTMQGVDGSVGFEALQQDPDRYQGRRILLGGQIIETVNSADKTMIMILQQPLDQRKRPQGGDVSLGRFLIAAEGFLDPAIYSRGRSITVVGPVMGAEERPLGGRSYLYPVVSREALHIWTSGSYPAEPVWHFGVGIGIGL